MRNIQPDHPESVASAIQAKIAASPRMGEATLSRLATYGLVTVLLTFSGFSLWSSVSTSHLGKDAIASSLLSDHYTTAAAAVAAEESLERKYRLEPGPTVRVRYEAAVARLVASLELVSRDGNSDDRVIYDQVLKLHAPYLKSINRMFDAVDRGDTPEVLRIDNDEVDPLFSAIEDLVDKASNQHHAQAIRALEDLRARERFNSLAVPIVFFVGLILVGLFSNVLHRTRKLLNRQRDEALHDSFHDVLTGLPNRSLLADRFEQALRTGRRDGSITGLLLIDLDRFKEVNDTLGHHYGDRLLAQIGTRLVGAKREIDTIARLGGDEFAVLLPVVEGLNGALKVANRLREVMSETFELDGIELEVEASIGVVISGEHGEDPATLMLRADVAMYVAKKQNLGVSVYDPGTDQHSPERLALLGQLRRGIELGELFLHYQPKVIPRTGQVIGVEALLRWRHPERGLVGPDEFIPLAEHTGLIGPLTQCVLGMALAQVKAWTDVGYRLPVAVNISARNLLNDQLVDQITDLLAMHHLSAEMLEIEVTESAIMLDPARAHDILSRLHALGIRIAIDDFGAGYTSLTQLKHLPISELKIDKSFVLTMQSDQANTLIVRSIIELGHNLGLSVVAEGVETAEALSMLSGLCCDVVQGYHLCRPQSAEDFLRWYSERANQPSVTVSPLPPTIQAAGSHVSEY
jgi:diguanylate cyclase (GGDEF)-like protein